MAEANTVATFDRPPVIERLPSNVGKRKSTTPQKFVGGYFKHRQAVNNSICCSHYGDRPMWNRLFCSVNMVFRPF